MISVETKVSEASLVWRMMTFSGVLPELIVIADDYDEALEQARKIDKRYCAGYLAGYVYGGFFL